MAGAGRLMFNLVSTRPFSTKLLPSWVAPTTNQCCLGLLPPRFRTWHFSWLNFSSLCGPSEWQQSPWCMSHSSQFCTLSERALSLWSLTEMLNSSRASIDPWGTPLVTAYNQSWCHFTSTLAGRAEGAKSNGTENKLPFYSHQRICRSELNSIIARHSWKQIFSSWSCCMKKNPYITSSPKSHHSDIYLKDTHFLQVSQAFIQSLFLTWGNW